MNAQKINLFPDARGWLMDIFTGNIAHAYVTACYPGVVKAWHLHQKQTDRLCCVSGMARIILRQGDETLDVVCGPLNPVLVTVPPNTWHGFAAIGSEPCLILNLPDRPWDAEDEYRLPWDQPDLWSKING